MTNKWNFWDFDKNLIHSLCTFSFQRKSINGLPTFCKNHIFRKYGPKSSRLIRMQGVLNCSISKMIWGMKLKFYETRHLKKQQMQLLTSSGCGQASWKIVNSQLYPKNMLSYEVRFFACGWRSIKTTNLFNHFKWVWLAVPKAIQHNMFIQLNLGMTLIFSCG